MEGKICVITGANSGLGFETAKALAHRGAVVAMVCRSEEKGKAALIKIAQETGNAHLNLFVADLSSQQSIKKTAIKIREKYPHIDVLVNNAGTWISELTYTEDKIEKMFAVNHLAYFYMSHLLYPWLKKSADGRIVSVSSDSHFQTRMHFDDLYLTKKYHGLRAYAQSKLANVLFTYELDRIKSEDNISVYAVQPGLVKTDIGLKHTKWLHAFAWKLRRSSGVTPDIGAKTQIYLATEEEVKGQSGKYWDKCKPKKTSKHSYKQEEWTQLWKISEELCKIDNFFVDSI
ncbi:MAG: SDR family oxidoreductase [Bacteroidota bacterium]